MFLFIVFLLFGKVVLLMAKVLIVNQLNFKLILLVTCYFYVDVFDADAAAGFYDFIFYVQDLSTKFLNGIMESLFRMDFKFIFTFNRRRGCTIK